MSRRPTLIKRLPSIRWQPRAHEQIVPFEAQSKYPALAPDFTLLEEELLPGFRDVDNDALQAQNQFRLYQLILIVGSILATALGAIQAARGHDVWPSIAEAGLSAVLTAIAFVVRDLKPQERYFTNRLKAELLRGDYFLFLGRIPPYSVDADLRHQLQRRVAEVLTEEAQP